MRKILPFVFTLIVILNSCTKTTQTDAMLKKTDSLLTHEKYDSAFNILKNINENTLNEEEAAYYNLLKTQTLYCLYIPATSDSAINNSINTFLKKNDKDKLARAYYYKGAILYSDLNNIDQAIVFTKKAEYLAEELKDLSLCSKIYSHLALINCKSENFNTALYYEKLALSYSYRTGDKTMTGIALDRIGSIFNAKDMLDSSFYYMKKMIPYIKYFKKEEQPGYFTNIGATFYNNGNLKEAFFYIKQSLSIKPTPHAYYLYGNILIEQDKDSQAWALWSKALDTDDIALKAEVMQWMADFKKEKGEYKEATLLTDSINMLKDSLKSMQKAETVMHLQKNIELNENDHQAYIRTRIIIGTAVILVIAFVLFVIYQARKISRTKNIIAENRRMMEKYTAELEKMTKSNKTNEREINRMKKKIEELRDRNSEILGHGQKLWSEIADGGNTTLWHKADYEAVVEFMRTKRPDVMDDIEKQYNKLTASATLYILLTVDGWTEDNIQKTMNMSPGALRTMKYRIKKRERVI